MLRSRDRMLTGAIVASFSFADIDGSNRHTVLSQSVPHPFSITIFGDYMYWSDWNHMAIERANRFTGTDRTILRNVTQRPNGIAMVHPLRQPKGMRTTKVYLCLLLKSHSTMVLSLFVSRAPPPKVHRLLGVIQ